MNLINTSIFIKKYWWVPLVIILILILLVLIYFRFSGKPAKPLPTLETVQVLDLPINVKAYTTHNLIPPTNTPKSLTVYTAKPESGFLNRVDEIANKFNVKGEKTQANDTYFGQGIFISDADSALLIYNNLISHQALTASQEPPMEFDENKLRQAAKERLSSLGQSQYDTTTPSITYSHFKGEDSYEDSNPINASLITFYFPQQIMNYELLSLGKTASVEFNKRNQITKTAVTAKKILTPKEEYPPTSYSDAIGVLSRGGGFIVSILGEGAPATTQPQNKNLATVNLTGAHIAYYDSPSGEILQPIWVFEGESRVNGSPVTIKIIVPAIQQATFMGTTNP